MQQAAAKILTISELNREIRSLLESHIGQVWVEGEVSNHRKQASGHQYFSLKDDGAQVSCVLFRGGGPGASLPLRDGMQVQAFGEVSVYEARGQYQLIIRLIQDRGLGALQARFEALKRKLQAEGLFDPDRKKSLPAFPLRIGIVTSPTGAALKDFLHVLSRRAPWLPVLIAPARVQGAGAAAEIREALERLDRATEHGLPPVDVIVIARGGGSMEDLWEFNDESLARAISASRTPVVSGVGHEIDFTIADFAADLRAPTPSAAAEIVAPDTESVLARIHSLETTLLRRLTDAMRDWRDRLERFNPESFLRKATRLLEQERLRLDDHSLRMERSVTSFRERNEARLRELTAKLSAKNPVLMVGHARQKLVWLQNQLTQASTRLPVLHRQRLEKGMMRLELLSPAAILRRGYSITSNAAGESIRSVNQVQPGEKITIQVADGTLPAVTSEI